MKKISFSNILRLFSFVFPLKRDNKALKILFFYNGIFVFAGSLLGPLYAVFAESIDASIFSISSSWAAFLFSTTICMFFMKKYGDRMIETEYFLLAGYLVRAGVWFSFPFVTTFPMLIVLQVILGLGEALGTPAYDAILAKHLDNEHQVEEYTDWRLIANFNHTIAILLGGYLVQSYGFTPLFIIMGCTALIPFLGILFQPRSLL